VLSHTFQQLLSAESLGRVGFPALGNGVGHELAVPTQNARDVGAEAAAGACHDEIGIEIAEGLVCNAHVPQHHSC